MAVRPSFPRPGPRVIPAPGPAEEPARREAVLVIDKPDRGPPVICAPELPPRDRRVLWVWPGGYPCRRRCTPRGCPPWPGRQGNDGNSGASGVLRAPNLPRSLKPIEFGHLDVQEYEIEAAFGNGIDRLPPIVDQSHLVPLWLCAVFTDRSMVPKRPVDRTEGAGQLCWGRLSTR